MSWTTSVGRRTLDHRLPDRRGHAQFLTGNFRPVGHLYFAVMGRHFGLDFPKYLIPIHALHLLNVWLLWLIARRLGLSPFAAGAGALFFAFNMVVFDVYWKPMYVFDLLCATFCLASLLFYMRRRLIAQLRGVLAGVQIEGARGDAAVRAGRLRILVRQTALDAAAARSSPPRSPSACRECCSIPTGTTITLSTSAPARFSKRPASTPRTSCWFRSPDWRCRLSCCFTRDKRVWFGMAAMFLFFVPLLFLGGRTFDAYCYLPLTGLAIACAGTRGNRRRASWPSPSSCSGFPGTNSTCG